MPIISIRNVSVEAQLGLWKIEESVDDFYSLYPWNASGCMLSRILKAKAGKGSFWQFVLS